MAKNGYRPTGPGWRRLKKVFDPAKLQRVSKAVFRRAMALAGGIMEGEVRRVIRRGDFQKNAKLTMALKGSVKPLVHSNALFSAITSEVIDDYTVFVGVKRTSDQYDVAVVVHGKPGKRRKAIPVTPKMRAMFWYLWLKSEGDPDVELWGRAAELWAIHQGPWYPISMATRSIIIPSRPFIERAFMSRSARKQVRAIWTQAFQACFSGAAA